MANRLAEERTEMVLIRGMKIQKKASLYQEA